jgi:hypothetical protein
MQRVKYFQADYDILIPSTGYMALSYNLYGDKTTVIL